MKKLTSSILMAITLVAGAATFDLASQSRADNAPRSVIAA